MNNIFFIILSVLIIIYIIYSIRKNRLDITTSFIWIVFCIILLFLSIWPKSLDWFASLLGIDYPPALFLTIAVIALFILLFIHSKKIENLNKKVINLNQELSIIKYQQKANNKKSTQSKKTNASK